MLSRDSEYEMWSRFVFELVIWPQQVTLARRTQPSGTLCLWQCSYLCTNLSVLFFWCKITFMVSYCCVFLYWCQIFKFQIGRVSIYHAIIGLTEVVHIWEFPPHHVDLLRSPVISSIWAAALYKCIYQARSSEVELRGLIGCNLLSCPTGIQCDD